MHHLVERYIDTWNEPAEDARRAAVAELWMEDGTYTDPLATVSGHDGIAGLIGAVQAQFPGHVIRLADDGVDAHHDIGRFRWELVPATGGEPVVIGFDVAVASEDGRLASVLGFIDKAPIA
jgi:hypothetical protein